MTRALPLALLPALCAILGACANEARPPAQPPRDTVTAFVTPVAQPNEQLLAAFRADDSRDLLPTARFLAERGDEPTREAAASLLVARARYQRSPAFRDTHRPLLVQANEAARIAPTPQQLEAQLDAYRDEQVVRVLAAMEILGGREIVGYCLGLGEDEFAALELRKGALTVLARHVDRRDEAVRRRSQAIWDRVAALEAVKRETAAAGAGAGNVANASDVVRGMGQGFRRCYNLGLAADAEMKGSVRVTAKIGPSGEVVSAVPTTSQGNLSAAVISCVVARVSSARFAPPEGGGATVVIPVTFTAN
jgi:hypothetical protein